jgi:hypothetical protein
METVAGACLAHHCYGGRTIAIQCDFEVGAFAIRALFDFIPSGKHGSFYAPYTCVEPEFRYVVEDASGQQHTFVPAEKLSRFLPSDIWVKDWYIHVMDHPKTYSKPVAAYLCREHAPLHPISITLLEIDQKECWPADQLSGKSPFDLEFLEKKTLATVPCPKN